MNNEKFIEIRLYNSGEIEMLETDYTSIFHHGYSTGGFSFVRNIPDKAKMDFVKMLRDEIKQESNKIKESKNKISRYKDILENIDIYLIGG